MIAVDTVLRTHNRSAMLEGAVESFFAADHSGVSARLLVVDNASTDATSDVLRALAERHGARLVPLREERPGGQHALNRGIASAAAEVVAFFDDDERIDSGWLTTIAREFTDPATDYIAGPVRPAGNPQLPDWLPKGFGGVLGIIESGAERRRFAAGFSAMLTQGNCALRRAIFTEVGPYPDALPTAEDRWLNQWLQAKGKQGFYCPDLVVDHLMQPERITPAYFRSWAAREGRDLAVCDRMAGKPSLLRQPWYWRQLAGDAAGWLVPGRLASERFRAELNLRVAWAYGRQRMGL